MSTDELMKCKLVSGIDVNNISFEKMTFSLISSASMPYNVISEHMSVKLDKLSLNHTMSIILYSSSEIHYFYT